jgi:hypothetical protein
MTEPVTLEPTPEELATLVGQGLLDHDSQKRAYFGPRAEKHLIKLRAEGDPSKKVLGSATCPICHSSIEEAGYCPGCGGQTPKLTKDQAGKLGGLSKSVAKVAAARLNGARNAFKKQKLSDRTDVSPSEADGWGNPGGVYVKPLTVYRCGVCRETFRAICQGCEAAEERSLEDELDTRAAREE